MRELTKQESKLFNSWFGGFVVGFHEAYDKVPANTGQAWNNLKFFKRVKYQKTSFNQGYNDGHRLYLDVLGKEWYEIDPEIYRHFWREHWLYSHINGKAVRL